MSLRMSPFTLPCTFYAVSRDRPNTRSSHRSSLSPCQKKVLVANASQELTVYDLESAHVLSSIRNVQSMVCDSPAMYVHDGNAILVGCDDGQARLFDPDLSSCIQTLDHGGQFTN